MDYQDEFAIAGNDDGSTTPLPAEIWAMVMDYVDFDSVLAFTTTSKTFRDSLPQQVTTLHIDSASQLNVSASRFREVRDINVLSLLHEEGGSAFRVDPDTVARASVFLSRLPILERVFFGGQDSNGQRIIFDEYHHEATNEDGKRLIVNLINHISHAFQGSFLPTSLCVQGLSCPRVRRPSIHHLAPCTSCILACQTWPLEHVIKFGVRGYAFGGSFPEYLNVCLKLDEVESIVKARPGGLDMLRSESRLLHLLGRGSLVRVRPNGGGTPIYMAHFFQQDLEFIKRVIQVAELDVRRLPRDQVFRALLKSFSCQGKDLDAAPKDQCYLRRPVFEYFKNELNLPIFEEDWLNLSITSNQYLPYIIEGMKPQDEEGSVLNMECLLLLHDTIQANKSLAIEQVMNLGALPLLTHFLNPECELSLRKLATRVARAIAVDGTDSQVRALAGSGFVDPTFNGTLFSAKLDGDLGQDSAQALGILILASADFRFEVLQSGIVGSLLDLLLEHFGKFLASSVMYSLCLGNPKSDFDLLKQILSPLSHLLREKDGQVLNYSIRALMVLIGHCHTMDQARSISDCGIFSHLLGLLNHTLQDIQLQALKAIKCLVQKDIMLLEPLMSGEVLSDVISFVSKELDFQIYAIEIMWEVVSFGGREHIRAVVSQGGLRSFCDMFTSASLHTAKLGLHGTLKVNTYMHFTFCLIGLL